MSQVPPHDSCRVRRRPRLPSTGPQSIRSSTRPSSRPRTEASENAPPLVSPIVSPPVTPVVTAVRERCSNTPPPVGWQYPSCSRCLVCGQLGCESCSVKVDPAATKQKLESLRLSTPYERAKLARSADELRSEESRQRARLAARYESWLEDLRTVELIRRHAVRVVMHEAAYRQQLYKEELAQRAAYVAAADQHILLLALQSSEVASRHATLAREREGFARLSRHYAYATQVVRLHQREATTREALRYNESSQWHRLQAQEVECRSLMGEHAAEQHRFCKSCWESREELCRQRVAGLESLAALAVAHREMLYQHAQQRCMLLASAEQGKRDVLAEEAATRMRLREEMVEEADYIEERHRIFARQRATLCKSEALQRQGIREAAERGYHTLFLDMRADEDVIYAAEVERADRRHSHLLLAVETLCNIQRDEDAAFTALMIRERDEAAGRRVWMAQKAEARAALWHRCVREKESVLGAEESLAREVLRKAAASAEVAVAEEIAAKARARAEFCACAESAVETLAREERCARVRLLSQMAADAELVLRWCETKRLERLAFADSEAPLRSVICRQEQDDWQQLCIAFARTCKAVEERAALEYQARAKAARSALDAIEQVAWEEAQEWKYLCTEETEQRCRAIDAFHYRCQVELLYEETQRRAFLARDELSGRAAVRAKTALFARYAAEAAVASLQTRLCEVMASEDSARACLYEHVGEWYDWVARQQREEELRLIEVLEQRIQEELRSRQEYMQEDERLYDPAESLVFARGGAEDEGQRAGGAAAAGLKPGHTHDLRGELVLQTLGNPVCAAPLSAAAVDFLVAVIDRAGRRRDAAQEHFAVAERNAREASKKVLQHERLYAAEKEKEEMYQLSSCRETEERERRMHQETLDKTRSQQAIAAEKRRLAEVQAELLQEQKKLDALKGSINKQYNR
ncbi:hypothetical protein, conserved [Leishmania donovani]|uniref:Uncharacterized protein n=1 Tax=Leishmania donovani TaxID=5661 RepID=A0A3Q8ICZ1_LEIDO|nr:hypothetical protein, conserved [Leishmania donovani]AYU80192.1 hypothetical protein LdCL_280008800 [Leishmania donovani]TPP54190.1 hypothetical protein CGC21_21745 [Leishmania donovani]CBZ35444.1 hypothetical protein, conserved [Leishmania donovani]